MRLTAPAMAERYAAGIRDEGAGVLDIGQVGTEMLYLAVGSRGLDGGLMCTASHNPKAYTGAKLVRRGAIALSGDAGIGEVRDVAAEIGDAPPAEPRGELPEADVRRSSRPRRSSSSTPPRAPDQGRARRRQRHGRPDGRPAARPLPVEQVTLYWTPDGEFPDHEPNPLLEENRTFIIDKVRSEGAELGIAWDGDADRCFFIDDDGEFVDGDFLTALLAESVLEKEPGATILYDVRASRAVRDLVERGGRHGARQPRRPRLLQDAHARRAAPHSAARCRATTTSATSTTPTRARSRRC